ncbi:hypothetical protein PIB30_069358, partial [Stylosanthes scabra]|nr:hypothetical protein [Stylosanthes scabra]
MAEQAAGRGVLKADVVASNLFGGKRRFLTAKIRNLWKLMERETRFLCSEVVQSPIQFECD